MDRESLKDVERRLAEIERKLESRKKEFNLGDLIQEIVGAVLFAFPFAVNADIWELSSKLNFVHTVFILLFLLISLYFAVEYSNLGNWKVEHVIGFLPLRFITIALVSFIVSALSLIILGVYPLIIDNFSWFLKATVLIALFSVIGSFGLDAAR